MSRLNAAVDQMNKLRAAGMIPASAPRLGNNQDKLKEVLNRLTNNGVRSDGKDQLAISWPFYHKLAWSNTATSYTFLNVAQNDFVSNWPQAGQLPSSMAYALRHVGVWADTGYTLATGAQNTAGAQADNTAIPGTIAEMLRIFHEQAKVEMWIGSRKILERFAVDLPRGVGPAIAGAVTTTAATTSQQIAVTANGAPIDAHRDAFSDPYPIEPGETVQLKVSLPGALTLPNSAVGVVCVELRGWKAEQTK